jgi:hypothetical protein
MMTMPDIVGGAASIFGRARLPNYLEVFNRDHDLYRQIVGVGQIARRAGGTNVRQLFRLDLIGQLEVSSLQTWHTMGQRLGAFMGFDQMQRQHASAASGKPGSRSGASPHQMGFDQILGQRPSRTSGKPDGRSGASPYQSTLMTKIKTFVPYLRYPVVSL